MTTPLFATSFQEITRNYDALLLDLWGVIHDGQNLYPQVDLCLNALRKEGREIIFLSNAPRRAEIAAQSLTRMGITEAMYKAIVTSGEVAYQHFSQREVRVNGKNYFYVGLEKDRLLLQGLDYAEVPTMGEADFVLLTHSYIDNQPEEEFDLLFEAARARKLPLVCINPDKEVVRLNGERVYCAGALAARYESKGGEVIYFGKPHANVYDACFRLLAGTPKMRILAVGDSLATDIRGAGAATIASALITGGILRKAVGSPDGPTYVFRCQNIFSGELTIPNYVVPHFNW